jgi:catechol 2,3-dioxygenase-like lactoylglutathione lyase family enzyme
MTDPTPSSKKPSSFLGINHLKIPVFDLEKSLAFYTSVFPFKHEEKYNHYTPTHELFAVMIVHEPTSLIVELRHAPEHAEKQRGWDPVTWGCERMSDLDVWAAWLDGLGVRRSPVFMGVKGWVLACEDVDGKIVRIYCNEEHEWTDHPDVDEYWLGTGKT